jgi:hypothetical protein
VVTFQILIPKVSGLPSAALGSPFSQPLA